MDHLLSYNELQLLFICIQVEEKLTHPPDWPVNASVRPQGPQQPGYASVRPQGPQQPGYAGQQSQGSTGFSWAKNYKPPSTAGKTKLAALSLSKS